MLALGIRYLCGWTMATDSADRLAAEWPPHPDRVFMALAAAHFDGNAEPRERDALQWLETLGAPAIHVKPAARRTVVTAYVPVNDAVPPRMGKPPKRSTPADGAGLDVLPEFRSRQARQFPVAIPTDPTVVLMWPNATEPVAHEPALNALCRRVVRIGHSSSLVQMWVHASPPAPTLVPAEEGEIRLRTPGGGRLAALARRYAAGLRPETAPWAAYAAPRRQISEPAGNSIFSSDVLVLAQTAGRRVGIHSTLLVTDALRRAVMSAGASALPEWLTGHRDDSRPSEEPHVAFLTLPDVGHDYADGHLLGVALAVPRGIRIMDALRPLIHAVHRGGFRIYNGRLLDMTLRSGADEEPPIALRAITWTRASRQWMSATPIVLDRYPKRNGNAEELVALACERIGLPRPVDVVTSPVSRLAGVPHARDFPALRLGKAHGPNRFHTHASITFDVPVTGPVLLGAGRFRGYGLCRPVSERSVAS